MLSIFTTLVRVLGEFGGHFELMQSLWPQLVDHGPCCLAGPGKSPSPDGLSCFPEKRSNAMLNRLTVAFINTLILPVEGR